MAEEEELKLPELRVMQICPIDFGECKKREEIEKEFNPSQVFLDIPYSRYKKVYENATRKAIKSFGLIPVLAETTAKAEGLLCNVCKTIQKSGYAVADISGDNKNVPYELGIIHSLSKKCCILCDSETKIPVDLSGLIINKYKDKKDIEKYVLRWIKDNVNEIVTKIKEYDELFQAIFFQLKNKDFRDIEPRINKLRQIENKQLYKDKFDRLNDELMDFLFNDEYRWKVIPLLKQIGNKKAEGLLICALENDDSEIRMSSIDILSIIGGKSSQKPLINCLKEKNIEILIKTIIALGNIGDKNAIESLNLIRHKEQDRIKYHVKQAIKKIKARNIK